MITRVVTGCVLVVSLALSANAAAADPAVGERIRAHIEFLADDSLRGRLPGTPGYDIAANYVRSQFQQMGLRFQGNPRLALMPRALDRLESTRREKIFVAAEEFLQRVTRSSSSRND